MSYVLPKDLSNKFSISLQTVYNYLNKHEWSIRTKKEFGKTYIHLDDFTNYFQPVSNTIESPLKSNYTTEDSSDLKDLEKSFQKLESDHTILLQENESLQKYNVNLQDQASKYAIMLAEEKKEKKDIMDKYETVQKEYHTKVESLLREKVFIERKYYLLLGIAIVLLVFLGWFLVGQNIDTIFGNVSS